MENDINSEVFSSERCSLDANWWAFGLRGLLSVIFGLLALYMPAITVVMMTLIFGAYAILDGLFSLISGINQVPKEERWGGLVTSGIFGIISGLIVLIIPQIASIDLMYFFWTMVSLWSLITGVSEIAAAMRLYQEIEGEWLLALSALFSVILGVGGFALLWFNPSAGVDALGLLIGCNSIVSGVSLLLLACKLYQRQMKDSTFLEEGQTSGIHRKTKGESPYVYY